jgi:hypothetical protein
MEFGELDEHFEKINRQRELFCKPLIESKYNLDSMIDILLKHRHYVTMKYYKGIDNDFKYFMENAIGDVITIIDKMQPSFLSPAYHYNFYVEHLINWINFDKHNNEVYESSFYRQVKFQIEFQDVLISIKTALDRLVVLFSYYYKGIMPHTTFGHQDSKGKFTSFMQKINELKDEDSLAKYIYDEYFEWIQIAVLPRDILIHYNDMGIAWRYDSSINVEIPQHYIHKFFLSKDEKESLKSYTYEQEDLKIIVDSYYTFFDKVLDMLNDKTIIIEKARF